jgi:hypothetical protein
MSHSIRALTRIGTRAVLGLVGATLLVCVSACGSTSNASAPTATATMAAPTPTSGPTIIYQDPLTSPSPTWINDPSLGCFFGSGGYHVKNQLSCGVPPGTYNVPGNDPGDDRLGNADISVQVKQISGPTTQLYGIGFRDFYQFDIESDGKWAFRVCHGACTTAPVVGPTANPAIHTGLSAANTLEVRAVGSHFDFFVNGTKVGQADDSTYPIGLQALIGEYGIEVVFSNLKITTAS